MASIAAAAQVRLVARDIKISHSVFALPFAVLAAFVARPTGVSGWESWSRFGTQVGLVVGCMVAARTWAMLVNRLADASIDIKNPRTARRVFAAGEISILRGWMIALASAAVFVLGASMFGVVLGNWWPAVLSVPVLLWIALYSWTKRFTWLCHVFLGGALAASPIAAALAIDPASVGLPSLGSGLHDGGGELRPVVWWISGMVLTWVAGFDVIYALQDVEFDRSEGLFSVPASLGWRAAVWVSRGLHLVAAAMLWGAMRADTRLGVVFMAGVILAWVLLVAEHIVLERRGMAGLDMAFFTLNGLVSCGLGIAGCWDLMRA